MGCVCMSAQAFRVMIVAILFWHIWGVVQEISTSQSGDGDRRFPDFLKKNAGNIRD